MPISRLETDLFISYQHVDDETATEAEVWVTEFQPWLRVRLRQIAGVEPPICRDQRLGAADVFSDRISSRLAKTALLIAVVWPGYMRSNWCARERASSSGRRPQFRR
jgi:hypothetical protein